MSTPTRENENDGITPGGGSAEAPLLGRSAAATSRPSGAATPEEAIANALNFLSTISDPRNRRSADDHNAEALDIIAYDLLPNMRIPGARAARDAFVRLRNIIGPAGAAERARRRHQPATDDQRAAAVRRSAARAERAREVEAELARAQYRAQRSRRWCMTDAQRIQAEEDQEDREELLELFRAQRG